MNDTVFERDRSAAQASSLYRLIYASTAEALSKQDIEAILDESETWNGAHGLTGALIFNSRFFMQILEGPRAEVEAIFARIREDSRHRSVVTITAKDTDERLFADWSMRYFGERQLPRELMREIAPGAVFRPQEMTEDQCLRLLHHLAAA